MFESLDVMTAQPHTVGNHCSNGHGILTENPNEPGFQYCKRCWEQQQERETAIQEMKQAGSDRKPATSTTE